MTRAGYRAGEVVPGTDLRVIRLLGAGGMGAAYEVEETSLGRLAVMKIVHPQLLFGNASHVTERMRVESRTIANLEHRNIVRIYRVGVTAETPPLPFYVMERLTGYSVHQLLRWHRNRQIPVPLSWVFWIGASLLSALDHAHGRGVVHRDVKPGNLFIHQPEEQRPIVKLLDFGVAEVLSDLTEGARVTQGFAGSYTHAAPEQLQGAAPSPEMDLYAAGIILFELLTGHNPFFRFRTPVAIARAHMEEPPPPIGQWRRVHPLMDELVQQLLAKDPKARPRSARQVIQALTAAKTEWMHESTVGGNTTEFQFDIDRVEEPWPTDAGSDGELSIPNRTPAHGLPSSALVLGAPELAKIPSLRLDDASASERPGAHEGAETKPDAPVAVSTAGTWGKTLDPHRRRSRALAAVALVSGSAALSGGGIIAWRVLSRLGSPGASGSAPVPTAPSASADPQAMLRPVPSPHPSESAAITEPAPVLPVIAASGTAQPVVASPAQLRSTAPKKAPAVRKSGVQQPLGPATAPIEPPGLAAGHEAPSEPVRTNPAEPKDDPLQP